METKKRALGIGLEQLFNNENLDLQNFEKQVYETTDKEEIIEVNISELRPNPYQPRKVFDKEALADLALSIKEHGVFQPIIIKKSIKGYEIIAGERRVRASKLAGLDKVPAIIRNLKDEQMMEIALLENLQRENLSAIEEAKAYKSMIDNLHLTQEQLSAKVGKSRSHVTNMLGLLKLPNSVQDMILTNKISMGHARVLSKISDEDQVDNLANKIIKEGLSVRDIEKISSNTDYPKVNKIKKAAPDNSRFSIYESLMREKVGTKIKIKSKKIEIPFDSDRDLERILEILGIGVEND
jgi:ParB family chromosome partitioning protein